jgi:hypothetical protein
MTEKTQEQLDAEAAAKQAAADAKAAEKAQKAEEAKQKKKEAAKDEREAKKAAEKEQKEKDKADKAAAKEAKKAEAAAAKEANRMPESNGVRRPKPETLCGKAWAIFDEISAKNGSAASIGESLKVAEEQGLNVGNVRAEYARWRKFYGVSGRVSDPTAAAPAPAATASGE